MLYRRSDHMLENKYREGSLQLRNLVSSDNNSHSGYQEHPPRRQSTGAQATRFSTIDHTRRTSRQRADVDDGLRSYPQERLSQDVGNEPGMPPCLGLASFMGLERSESPDVAGVQGILKNQPNTQNYGGEDRRQSMWPSLQNQRPSSASSATNTSIRVHQKQATLANSLLPLSTRDNSFNRDSFVAQDENNRGAAHLSNPNNNLTERVSQGERPTQEQPQALANPKLCAADQGYLMAANLSEN